MRKLNGMNVEERVKEAFTLFIIKRTQMHRKAGRRVLEVLELYFNRC